MDTEEIQRRRGGEKDMGGGGGSWMSVVSCVKLQVERQRKKAPAANSGRSAAAPRQQPRLGLVQRFF